CFVCRRITSTNCSSARAVTIVWGIQHTVHNPATNNCKRLDVQSIAMHAITMDTMCSFLMDRHNNRPLSTYQPPTQRTFAYPLSTIASAIERKSCSLIHASGNAVQLTSQRNRSHTNQPIGGVRARPFSNPFTPTVTTDAAIVRQTTVAMTAVVEEEDMSGAAK